MHLGLSIPHVNYAHNISHNRTEGYLIHNHSSYELYYYLQGNASFLVNGVEYQLDPHTLLVIPPNVFHGVRVHDEQPYERHTLEFGVDIIQPERRALLTRYLPYLPQADKAGGAPCVKKNMEGTLMHSLFLQIDQLNQRDPELQKQVMPILVENIMTTIMLFSSDEEPSHIPPPNPNPAQDDIITYLNQHFTEPITLDDLSEKFYISKHHLNRSFRKATGTTVRDYLITKRVNYVQQMLINGIPVTQAASLAGFGDYTAFYRAYLKRFGHAPSQDLNPHCTMHFNLEKALKEQQVITPDNYAKLLEESD